MSIEEMRARLGELDAMATSGQLNTLDEILKVAGEVASLKENLVKSQAEANKEKIADAEGTLLRIFQTAIANSGWEQLTGKPIDMIVFRVTPGNVEEGKGPVTTLLVNPKRSTAPRKISGEDTPRRGKIASKNVSRVVDGTLEVMTVKDMVQKYASDEVRNTSLYTDKAAWGMLYPRVNRDLDVKFDFVPETVEAS
jgi:hypothetical protein